MATERSNHASVIDISRPPLLLVGSRDHAIATAHQGRAYPRLKRALDVIGSLVLLLALAPLFLALALVVKCSSPGNVFFVQTRVGKDMTPFQCYKLRTMVPDAEIVLLENPQLRDALAVSWKLREDPRVTRAGRVLRKTSLDELPQLWNVLRGEMSFIGPRPVQVKEIGEQYGAYGPIVTQVRPGISGLWQVSGRSNTTYEQRVRLDVAYVHHSCLLVDLQILLRTFPVLVTRKGAT